jgi:NAD(P)-dependent dehydrogenase (short-subunit alcohol dehydrogenase family)
MSDLSGKHAVITGATKGIGRAIAECFARAGARVGLIARTVGDLEAFAAELRAAGHQVAYAAADVSDSRQVDAAAVRLRAALGPADLLVNNAGNVIRKPTFELTDAEWRSLLSVNLDGTFYATRAFGPDLTARAGRIINIASIAGRQGTAMLAAYCASKHAVVGLTRALAEELRGAKVCVNAICPGSVDTDMLREGMPGARPAMTPDDIARTALFLAADAPAAMTGTCVDIFG